MKFFLLPFPVNFNCGRPKLKIPAEQEGNHRVIFSTDTFNCEHFAGNVATMILDKQFQQICKEMLERLQLVKEAVIFRHHGQFC